jgi:hypothetical protein
MLKFFFIFLPYFIIWSSSYNVVLANGPAGPDRSFLDRTEIKCFRVSETNLLEFSRENWQI